MDLACSSSFSSIIILWKFKLQFPKTQLSSKKVNRFMYRRNINRVMWHLCAPMEYTFGNNHVFFFLSKIMFDDCPTTVISTPRFTHYFFGFIKRSASFLLFFFLCLFVLIYMFNLRPFVISFFFLTQPEALLLWW